MELMLGAEWRIVMLGRAKVKTFGNPRRRRLQAIAAENATMSHPDWLDAIDAFIDISAEEVLIPLKSGLA